MSISHVQPVAREAAPLVAQAATLLDEHHLVAWTRSAQNAERFGIDLGAFLKNFADTQVCSIAGWLVRDLDTFCKQLEIGLARSAGVEAWPVISRQVFGRNGVIAHLRHRGLHGEDVHHVASKRRYYLWRDADALLRSDESLFNELVDALTGVAAASEYCDEDLLFIQRAVFIGGPALNAYADKPSSQFNVWLETTSHDRRTHDPLWGEATHLAAPPFARLSV